jgi:hypothetical protein
MRNRDFFSQADLYLGFAACLIGGFVIGCLI